MNKIIILFTFFSLQVYAASVSDSAHTTKAESSQFTKPFDPNAPGDPGDNSFEQFEERNSNLLSEKQLLLKEKYEQAENDYYIWNSTYKRDIFEFQYISGIIIFIVVLFIVFMGLGFSAWQFYLTMQQVKTKHALVLQNKEVGSSDPTDSLKSDLEISTTGIKLNSSVLGVIIIALSLAFFYLYLVYVYPINMVTH
jgi:hypothetical protein